MKRKCRQWLFSATLETKDTGMVEGAERLWLQGTIVDEDASMYVCMYCFYIIYCVSHSWIELRCKIGLWRVGGLSLS